MNDNTIAVAGLLKTQYETLKELLETEKNKTEVLVNGDVEKLGDLINIQQALLMTSENLEKQRDSLCKSMGIRRFSLKDFFEKYDPGNETELKILIENYSDIFSELQKIGETNNKLVTIRLQTLSYMKSLFLGNEATINENITYSKNAVK